MMHPIHKLLQLRGGGMSNELNYMRTHPFIAAMKGNKNASILGSCVEVDDVLREAIRGFDYEFGGTSTFAIPNIPVPETKDWSIGLIVGPSGSGKSSILRTRFGVEGSVSWDPKKAIVSQMPDDPEGRLMGAGLNSIPVWCRPYHVLSTGEKFRADLARRVGDGVVIDEFTSTVDRNVAKSCSAAISRYIRSREFQNIVFATCHRDITEWLSPDWVMDTEAGELYSPGCLRRPKIQIQVHCGNSEAWRVFRDHHYLSGSINKSSRCFLAVWNNTLVGFASALAFPNGNFKNAWREHRTVVLPDFQGMGIGVRLSDFVAAYFVRQGCRYFSKTSHPRMGEYREASKKWKPTSKNKRRRLDYVASHVTKEDSHKMKHRGRLCYSHEYIGTVRPDGAE